MSETTTQTDQQTTTTENNQAQDNSAAIANAIWGEGAPVQAAQTQVDAAAASATATTQTPTIEPQEEVLDINEWLKREIGVDSADAFKNEWGELRKLKAQPVKATEETQWANEESKKLYEALKGDKRDEVRRILNQQADLTRLENYDVSDVAQAAEIIKTNLQFKHKDLDLKQIDRLYARQYSMPEKPQQGDQSDDDYTLSLEHWQRQVQEKEQDIMIDAKIAKPELGSYKSQIVFPDIPKADNAGQQGPSQEDLAAQQAFRNDFVQKLGTDYRNFNGYSTIAKDGEVELPISYGLNDDEKLAFNPTIQKAVDNIQGFLDKDLGWWNDETKSFNINKMQEDLYLLLNRDKVLSKFAGEGAAQRYQHHLKISNNIKLSGVNNQMDIPTGQVLDEKARNQKVADAIWEV